MFGVHLPRGSTRLKGSRARAAGLATSLDTNWDPLGRWMEDIGRCLPHLDLVFLNEDEARMVTGHVDPRPAADVLLGRGARTAILKLGARGCFVGAFLSARLRGASLAEAARFANAVGRSGCSMWVEPRGYRTASTYQPGFAASAEALAKGSGVWVNMLMGTRQ